MSKWIKKKAQEDPEKEKLEDVLDRLVEGSLDTFIDVMYEGNRNYFFEDNPGAEEAILEWISKKWSIENLSDDQKKSLLDWEQLK